MTTSIFAPFKRALPHAFAVAAIALASGSAMASSHREAPSIAGNPRVDATDLYMFRSYETGRAGYVTVLANYIPFQDPQGGPNFYMFDDKALYEIEFDTNGDGKEDITFQFRFTNTSKGTTLPVNGVNVKIPLINAGVISTVADPALNVVESYTVNMVKGDRRTGSVAAVLPTAGGVFYKPVDNIGDKSFGSTTGYAAYANQHIYDVAIPGCDPGRIFVGQRKESFYIAVGKIFDLFNLDPLGPEVGGNNNDLEGKNISTIAMEIPISCLVTGTDPVIGAFTTASLRQGRLLNGQPPSGIGNASLESGAWTQVSRLGMPLVNEVIIGLDDKDLFNSSKPINDGQFINYVTNPTLPALLQSVFNVGAPTNFPRNDLVAAFLTGIKGLNQPLTPTPSEMLRLNTSIAPTAYGSQNPLGVAAMDLAGFPNGRRPADDVVDLSLRVAEGALCVLTTDADIYGLGCVPADAPTGSAALTDGVRKVDTDFQAVFPYLNTPLPGNTN